MLGSPLCRCSHCLQSLHESAAQVHKERLGKCSNWSDSPGVVMRCSGEVFQELTLHSRPNAAINPHLQMVLVGCQFRTQLARKGHCGCETHCHKRSKWHQILTPSKLSARSLFTRADLQ